MCGTHMPKGEDVVRLLGEVEVLREKILTRVAKNRDENGEYTYFGD